MKAKHPGGRPTSYRPEFCQRVVALMAEGRSLEGCAALLGVHPDSLNEWQKIHPQFSVAVRAGRAAATTYWENRLLAWRMEKLAMPRRFNGR
jgi:transposase-like protein